jgi:hypothetical protein
MQDKAQVRANDILAVTNAEGVFGSSDNRCMLFREMNVACEDNNCLECSLASNAALVGRFMQEVEQVTTPPMTRVELTPHALEMLAEMSGPKWTVAAVKDYCDEHGLDIVNVDRLYNRIKRLGGGK